MPFLKTTLFILFLLSMDIVHTQNIKSHQWENRLLLLITDGINNEIYKNQITELKNHNKGLKERKLIIYQIKKDAYKKGVLENSDWEKSTKLYNTYKTTNTSFEILLIGLDGGIKLKQSKLLNCKDLFSIIDVMPMRRTELRKN